MCEGGQPQRTNQPTNMSKPITEATCKDMKWGPAQVMERQPADPKTPDHDEIWKKIISITTGNICPWQHNREALDDIIADLSQYRDSIASVEFYEKANLL